MASPFLPPFPPLSEPIKQLELWLVAWQGATCYSMDSPTVRSQRNTRFHGLLNFLVTGEVKLSAVLANERAAAMLKGAQGKQSIRPTLPT